MTEQMGPQAPDDELQELGVGIALTTDPQMTRGLLGQFCLALGDATGLRVVARGVSSYAVLREQLQRREVDVVWLPPIPALRATAAGEVTPIALPIREGASVYHAALFTRHDTGLRSLSDLHRATAAWVDPESAAGYFIIRSHMQALGADPAHAFGENLFMGSHDAVAEAVASGRADVGATFVYFNAAGAVHHAGWGRTDVHILDSAGPIPNDIVAARVDCPPVMRRLVQSALVDVQHAPLREAARALLAAEAFAVPLEEHLAPLRRLIQRVESPRSSNFSVFPGPRGTEG